MDIKEELLKEHSRAQTLRIVTYISDDSVKFEHLMTLFFSNKYIIAQRAAWVVSVCHDKHPKLILPYLKRMIENLNKEVHPAIKRNTVRVLQFVHLPNDLLGSAANACFKLLQSLEEPIAVKAFSMTVLLNICKREPGLKNELKLIIQDQMPYGSAGFISRGKKVLRELDKIKA